MTHEERNMNIAWFLHRATVEFERNDDTLEGWTYYSHAIELLKHE